MGVRYKILRNDLPHVAAKLQPEVNTIVEKFIHDVDAHAAAETPVDTGNLRNNRSVDVGGLQGSIHWHAPYALYVHEGTRYMAGRPFAADAVEKCTPALEAAIAELEGRLT